MILPTRSGELARLTLGRTRRAGGEGEVDAPPPLIGLQVQTFEKKVYSKGLKLSKAVHSSSADILICQLCVCHF